MKALAHFLVCLVIVAAACALTGFLFIGQAAAAKNAASAAVSEGERLERQMWDDIRAKRWSAVEARVAPGFQAVHAEGARDRAAELRLFEGIDVSDYWLTDVRATEEGPAIVVTYKLTAEETIGDKRVSVKRSPRQTSFAPPNPPPCPSKS